jgi:uncharacterized membrane protein YgdD (TMEM256/DUF423 family)
MVETSVRSTSAFDRSWMAVAGLWALMAVLLGALGAHALRGVAARWPEDTRSRRLENWDTAARYQFGHALALAIAAFMARKNRWGQACCCMLLASNALFSGGLYAYAWSGQTFWTTIVPVGGVGQLAGWALWIAAAWCAPPSCQGEH